MPAPSIWERYSQLLTVRISGIERVGELAEQGRIEDARDHLISSARGAWQYRWPTGRTYTLRRLGEELDTERFQALAPIARMLTDEEPGGAAAFLDYLRRRAAPNVASFVGAPVAPAAGFNPQGQYSVALWNAVVTTGDPAVKAALDQRIAQYLDPHLVITWHETDGCWPQLVMSSLFHGGIDDATLCKLILFGLDHAEQCNVTSHLSEPAQTSIGGNHLFAWISAWLKFTILFPEFRRTPALQHSVIARLDDETSKQVMPDGSMIEGCPGYQNCCLYGASEFLRLAAEHGLQYPGRVRAAWARMIRHVVGLMRPDFCVPFFGDSHDRYVPQYLWQLPRFYDMSELDWAVSGGKKGRPPAYTSCAATSIGYYTMRSGWERDAVYMCFDGGRFGQGHQHEDKLGFELCAFGRPFLVDAGDHSYSEHWMREWVVLAQAHNTVLIDGAGQCRWREDRDKWYSHVPLKNPWTTGPVWDVTEADFAGPYERDIGDVKVRRRVVFHKGAPPFFWITDWIEGTRTHEVTELFHFAHDIGVVEEIPGGVRTRIPGGPDLAVLLMAAQGGGVSVERHCGERNPTRGWVSPELYREEPAWEVHFTGAGATPMRRDFLLLPWRATLPDVSARLNIGGGSPAITLTIGGRDTTIALPSHIKP
ncbi:MAG: heparinase II/III family protein [Planctomycetes bacterium]|nr:heparinase II/III family protein [Planctomycetota bacterium]